MFWLLLFVRLLNVSTNICWTYLETISRPIVIRILNANQHNTKYRAPIIFHFRNSKRRSTNAEKKITGLLIVSNVKGKILFVLFKEILKSF